MLIDQVIPNQMTVRKIPLELTEINRLLAAAIINRQFCSLLLKDPARALTEGFAGERFILSRDEQDFILSLRAASLQEFVARLCDHLSVHHTVAQPSTSENFNEGDRFL